MHRMFKVSYKPEAQAMDLELNEQFCGLVEILQVLCRKMPSPSELCLLKGELVQQ